MHLVRNTLGSCPKYWSAITKQMRGIYTAPSLPAAETLFAEFNSWPEPPGSRRPSQRLEADPEHLTVHYDDQVTGTN